MKKGIRIVVLFLLTAGTSFLLQSVFPINNTLQSQKSIEVTKEATLTAVIVNFPETETATVKRVVDGDTIELADGRKLRYIGINTPETVDPRKPVECFGKEASSENKKLVEGKEIRMEKDISQIDKYGRLLRYVYVGPPVGELMVNDYLVRQGFAHAATYPPDVKYADTFTEAETEARTNNSGLWSGCALSNPANK